MTDYNKTKKDFSALGCAMYDKITIDDCLTTPRWLIPIIVEIRVNDYNKQDKNYGILRLPASVKSLKIAS